MALKIFFKYLFYILFTISAIVLRDYLIIPSKTQLFFLGKQNLVIKTYLIVY